MDLEDECPECGAPLLAGAKFCIACKAEIDWEGNEEDTIDEILKEIAPESMDAEDEAGEEETENLIEPVEEEPEAPGEALEEEVTEELEEIPPEEIPEPREDAVEEEPDVPEEALEEEVAEEMEELPPEEILEEIQPIAFKKPKLYAGLFSVVGLTFIILTVAALIATILALRWDTWINGAAEESIGDRQVLFVYLGVAGIVVCAIISVVDVFRHSKGRRG